MATASAACLARPARSRRASRCSSWSWRAIGRWRRIGRTDQIQVPVTCEVTGTYRHLSRQRQPDLLSSPHIFFRTQCLLKRASRHLPANSAQRPGCVPADQRLNVGQQMAQRGNGSGIAPVARRDARIAHQAAPLCPQDGCATEARSGTLSSSNASNSSNSGILRLRPANCCGTPLRMPSAMDAAIGAARL